jgi:hypothetical protein
MLAWTLCFDFWLLTKIEQGLKSKDQFPHTSIEFSLYAYVNNNSINSIDSFGLCASVNGVWGATIDVGVAVSLHFLEPYSGIFAGYPGTFIGIGVDLALQESGAEDWDPLGFYWGVTGALAVAALGGGLLPGIAVGLALTGLAAGINALIPYPDPGGGGGC